MSEYISRADCLTFLLKSTSSIFPGELRSGDFLPYFYGGEYLRLPCEELYKE
jgi:hypothetical protein